MEGHEAIHEAFGRMVLRRAPQASAGVRQGPFSYFCPAYTNHEFIYNVGGTIELERDGDYVILRFFPTYTGEAQAAWWGGGVVNGTILRTNTPGLSGDYFTFHGGLQFNITSYRFYSPAGSAINLTLYASIGHVDCSDDIDMIQFDASFPSF